MKAALISALLVGTGGFVGAIYRYWLSGFVHSRIPLAVFPYGTLVVNLVGCFLMGIFAGFVESRQLIGPEFRKFAAIGLLGGFTTYSTFGYETFTMIRSAEYLRAASNVGIHVILGLALMWAGYGLITR